MHNVNLEQGTLKSVTYVGTYNSGEVEFYKVEEKSVLTVNGINYIPLYDADERRKEYPAVNLYKDGNIKSIALQETQKFETKVGTFSAEKVSFYEDGSIKRLFPLDGQITGYWSEDDEYTIAKEHTFSFPFGEFTTKVISIYFYNSGEIKSLTLWGRERVNISAYGYSIEVRNGISFYKDGKIKSLEPALPIVLNTKIGQIECFDKNAVGISGDINSVSFNEDGSIKSVITGTNVIEVYQDGKLVNAHSPREEQIMAMSDEKELITVKVEFDNDKLIIDNVYNYEFDKYTFKVKRYGNKLTLTGDLLSR